MANPDNKNGKENHRDFLFSLKKYAKIQHDVATNVGHCSYKDSGKKKTLKLEEVC